MATLTDSLVPLLFVIYINTMSSFVSSCLFKVDTKLYHSISNPTSTKWYQTTVLMVCQQITEVWYICACCQV